MADREEHKFQFRLEEYKSLRGEIDTRIKEAFSLVIYCLTAMSAIYGTIVAAVINNKLSPETKNMLTGALWLAVFFPAFGLMKSLEIWNITTRIAAHLRKLEADLGIAGWESAIHLHRTDPERGPVRRLGALFTQPPYWALWIALIAVALWIRFDYQEIVPLAQRGVLQPSPG